ASKAADKDAGNLSGKDLRAAYDSHDEIVRKTIHRTAGLIGIGIGSMLNVLGPEMVVLGGGVVEAFGDDFVERIGRSARTTAFEINSKNVRIARAELGDDAVVIGAAMLAHQMVGCAS